MNQILFVHNSFSIWWIALFNFLSAIHSPLHISWFIRHSYFLLTTPIWSRNAAFKCLESLTKRSNDSANITDNIKQIYIFFYNIVCLVLEWFVHLRYTLCKDGHGPNYLSKLHLSIIVRLIYFSITQ